MKPLMQQRCGIGLALAGMVLAWGLGGCTSTPVTRRPRMNLVDEKAVVRASVEAFEQMKRENRISHNPRMNQTLQRVGHRLADTVFWDMPLADWEFVVFDAPGEVNALAMPGGKVAVFSGAFDVATTDDQLAVILAHEIAHVTAGHVNERLSQQMMLQAGGVGLAVVSGGGLTAFGVMTAYQLGSGVVGLSFDRKKESEADHMGLIYMARAGYDPHAAIELWEKMDQVVAGKTVPAEWLSTHPSHTTRLADIYRWMPEAEEAYRKAKEKET